MKIDILWPWELPKKIDGIAVVIDVLAATTNIAWFLYQRVSDLILVNSKTIEESIMKYSDALVIGESLDPKLQKYFQCDNSPTFVTKQRVEGKRVIYMTNNGSRVIEEVLDRQPDKVITASFTNISLVADFLKESGREKISLVAAGEINNVGTTIMDKKAEDDRECTEALAKLVKNLPVDLDKVLSDVSDFISSHYLYGTNKRQTDIQIVTDLDSNPVVPICQKIDNMWVKVFAAQVI